MRTAQALAEAVIVAFFATVLLVFAIPALMGLLDRRPGLFCALSFACIFFGLFVWRFRALGAH